MLADKRLAQGPDERYAAADSSFEEEVDPGGIGGLEQVRSDVGEQLLVRGDDRLAPLDGLEDQSPCRLDAADELDDEVDVRVSHHRRRIVGEQRGVDSGTRPRGVSDRHAHDLERDPRPLRDRGRALFDQLHERGADVAAAQHAHLDGSVAHGRQR